MGYYTKGEKWWLNEEWRQLARKNMKAHRERKKAFTDELKAAEGCRDCGERDPVVLDFHHLNPAEKHPSLSKSNSGRGRAYGINRLSWPDLRLEVEKCVVLCANCHRREEHRLSNKPAA